MQKDPYINVYLLHIHPSHLLVAIAQAGIQCKYVAGYSWIGSVLNILLHELANASKST